jgi:TP901 family phage tail tape measure protein
MPLGVREVLLVIRAQNMSSGVLRGIAGDFQNLDKESKAAAQQAMAQGTSMMALGAGIGAIGAAGLAFLGKATADAKDYNAQVALTTTQMSGVKASFQQVAQAGLDVASKVAVPFDQIQSGLYDIFSSMNVNLPQAQYLLTNFSKEAVAGQVDLSVAEKASIGIMNAYGMKVSQVSQVQDTMFNLVKLGVGTYADFANVIGLVTPSAVRANQTFTQTAALMAFTTRNGLSASSAASAVARGLDAIGKSRQTIQDFGQVVVGELGVKAANALGITAKSTIQMTNAAGDLLPVNQIITELGTSLKGLNPTQMSSVLTAMFKGTGGTIQAMRFITLAVKNYGSLNSMVKEMGASKGDLQAAYNVMANTPAMQIQLLKNNFHVLMVEIGNVLLPILNKATIGFKNVFEWIDKVPKPVLELMVAFVAITSTLAILTGIVLIFGGAWLVLSTILEASEIALLPIIGTAALVVAAVLALAVAAYFIVKYWGPISTWFKQMWSDIYTWVDKTWDMIWAAVVTYGEKIYKYLQGWVADVVSIWSTIYDNVVDVWDDVERAFTAFENWVASNFDKWWLTHGEAVKQLWSDTWNAVSRTAIAIWGAIDANFKAFLDVFEFTAKAAWAAVVDAFTVAWNILLGILKVAFAIFLAVVKIYWAGIELEFQIGWDVIETIFRVAFSIIEGIWKIFWTVLIAAAKIFWAALQLFFKLAWDTLVLLFDLFLDIMTGHWHTAWVDIESYGKQVWNAIGAFLKTAWGAIANAADSVGRILESTWDGIWGSIRQGAVSVWDEIQKYLKGIWGDIESGAKGVVAGLKTIWSGIEGAFKDPVNWVIQYVYDGGIRSLWDTVMNAIGLSKLDLPHVNLLSSGGLLGGFGGGDKVPALLEPGEAVVDKYRTKKYSALFAAMGVPGFSAGGIIGNALDIGKMMLAASTGNSTAFVNAMTGMAGGNSGAAGSLATMASTLPVALMTHVVDSVWKSITGSAKTASSGGGTTGPGGGSAAQNMALARQLMPAWSGGPFWSAWDMLWNRESGWDQFAYNASSGATGIPQALPYNKMPKSAWLPSQGGSANVHAQETWGIGYIQGRYGNPSNAWDHEIAFGWYDNGGPLHPGYTLAYNGTGHDEQVSTGKGGPTQNFYITTQEINPRKHAAELGFELARRSS